MNQQLASTQLSDFSISSASNGQVLTYNSGSSKWVNNSPTLASDSDVSISTPKMFCNIIQPQVNGIMQVKIYLFVSFSIFHKIQLNSFKIQIRTTIGRFISINPF